MSETKEVSDSEKSIFQAIDQNDVNTLKTLLLNKQNVNNLDENFMTPLQHAAFKGSKKMVQMLLDQGADVNICKHQYGYTALHFAGLSGNSDVCGLLLMAGANSTVINSVGRTPSQMAAFVGNHNCVSTINNFIPKADIECYTIAQGESAPLLSPFLADGFHKFVMQISIHPVRVILNLQKIVGLMDHLNEIQNVLKLMCDREMKRGNETNEVMSFKFHYMGSIVGEIIKLSKNPDNNKKEGLNEDKKLDSLEVFIRKLLKTGKDGNLDYMELFLREVVRNFPFRECTIFRQMVTSLTSTEPPSALSIIASAINGQRGFLDNVSMCNTCGEEKPAKKCSKCKVVQYCDRECQRLHWFLHKKACTRFSQQGSATAIPNKPSSSEISADIQKLLVN